MIPVSPKNEFTATVPVANSGEYCSHVERLATAQALTNRTHNLDVRTKDVEAITVVGTGIPLSFASALESLADVQLPDKLGLNNVLKTMGQGLAAWIKYTMQRVPGVALNDQTFTWPPIPIAGGNATWGMADLSSVPSVQQAVADTNRLYLSLPSLPRWGYLKAVSITFQPNNGHAGLPGTKPRLSVGRILVDTITQARSYTEQAAADDASADVTAYELTHHIILSGFSVPLASTPYMNWQLKFTGEAGANSGIGLKVLGVTATVSGTP